MLVIANFGGPRSLDEIEPFLCALLCDKSVIRTRLPAPLHNILFRRIAKRRALTIKKDYEAIGGKSPIFDDTEAIAEALQAVAFHRYLSATHEDFLHKIQSASAERITLFPMFPQYCSATTGSIARFFSRRLPEAVLRKLRWIKSYASHPAYIRCMQQTVRECLVEHQLQEEHTAILYSAHGIPQAFVASGDLYQEECERSFKKIAAAFPRSLSRLCYQSKFGPGEWLRP